MGTAVGLDRAVEYVEKLEKFRQAERGQCSSAGRSQSRP